MRIRIRREVKEVMDIIESKGYSVYVVGGAVRNQLLGIPISDWDLTTNAKPMELIEIFNKEQIHFIPTGAQHGTITVYYKGLNIEVTTFRIDGNYSDSRRPDRIYYTDDLKQDLSRRDFTINALAYNYRNGLIDYFNGVKDIREKRIRCVGSPKDRFEEDALRMLRAIRFANTLNFTLDTDSDLEFCIRILRERIDNVSMERVQVEFNKILTTGHEIRYFDLLLCLFPNLFSNNAKKNIFLCNIFLKKMNEKDFVKNLTSLFLYDILNIEFLEKLKYSNSIIKKIKNLKNCYSAIQSHGQDFLQDKDTVDYILKKYLLNKYDLQTILDANSIIYVQNSIRLEQISSFQESLVRIEKKNDPILIKDLAVNGEDLKKICHSGIEIGKALEIAQEYVWKHPEKNKKDILLNFLKTFF